MLTIEQATYDAIVAHARRDHPDEACGVIVGPAGSDRAERLIEMTSEERSMTGFKLDTHELFRLHKEMNDRDEEIVVIYHSHTMTEAYPSRTDVSNAEWSPGVRWLIVSTRDPDTVELRSYRIVDGDVSEEPVRVVAALD